MTKNLHSLKHTSVRADKISTMPERRVVESIVTIRNCIFIANTHCEPVTTVLLDLKSHLAWFVAFLMKGRLEKSKMIVIAFSRFDEII